MDVHVTITFTLPFHITGADGEYKTDLARITLRTLESDSPRNKIQKNNAEVVGLFDIYGLYKYTHVTCSANRFLEYDLKSPPLSNLNDFYQWYLFFPEIYHFATKALNSLLNVLKASHNLFHLPTFSPLMISGAEITITDDLSNTHKVSQALLSPIEVAFGLSQQLNQAETTYKPARFYKLLLLNAKRSVFENNLRQAILDLNNAFEYYVNNELSMRMPIEEREQALKTISTKNAFLDEYEEDLPQNVLEVLNHLEEKGERYPSIFKTLKEIHKRIKIDNLSNSKLNKIVARITRHRNLAAHGGEIAYEMHKDVIDSIRAFEEFLSLCNENDV